MEEIMKSIDIALPDFIKHLSNYEDKILPLLIIYHLIAAFLVIVTLKKVKFTDRLISGFLVILWLTEGIIHQMIFGAYAPIMNYFVGTFFSLQAILILIFGVFQTKLSYDFKAGNPYSILGLFFIIYGIVGFPIVSYLLKWGPVLGLICPNVTFTFGYLLLSKPRMPKNLIIIPGLWAIIGGAMAVIKWNYWGDIVLVASGLVGVLLLGFRRWELMVDNSKKFSK